MAQNWTQGDFWSMAGQVIPVMGLAFVIEARAISKRWSANRPAQRAVESTVIAIVGVALTAAFIVTLAVLRSVQDRSEWVLRGVEVVLTLSFIVLVWNALSLVFAFGVTGALTPNRLRRWRLRRWVRRKLGTQKGVDPDLLRRAKELTRTAHESYEFRRSRLDLWSCLSAKERAEVKSTFSIEIDAPHDPEAAREFELLSSLRAAYTRYRRLPTPIRARRVRTASMELAKGLYASARLQHVRLLSYDDYVENRLDYHLDQHEERYLRRIQDHIARAGEPGLLPW